MDKELDVAKDNLKTFVDRYDGSNPVKIPKSPSFATLKPVSQPKKSSSTSSLSKYKTKEAAKKQEKMDNNDVGKSSDFITPARNDNDSIPPVIPNQKPSELPGKLGAPLKQKKIYANVEEKKASKTKETTSKSIAKDDEVQVGRNITKNLLDQLDQIQIKPPSPTPTNNPNDKTAANGVNYLQVDNNLPTTSATNGGSALSSRGTS